LVEVRSSNDSFISDTPESRQQRQAKVELDCEDDEEEDGPDEDGDEDLREAEDEESVVEDLGPVEDEAIDGDHKDEHVQAPDDVTEEDSPEDVAAEEAHATEEAEDPVEETHEDTPARGADDVTEVPDPLVPAPRPTRNRRPPKRFDAYQMKQVTPRPAPQLDALQALLRSDVLNCVDGATAKEVISALLYSVNICIFSSHTQTHFIYIDM